MGRASLISEQVLELRGGYQHFDPREPRDSHGRWTKGAGGTKTMEEYHRLLGAGQTPGEAEAVARLRHNMRRTGITPRALTDVIANMQPVTPPPSLAAVLLKQKQHNFRRRNLDTWTVNDKGEIVRHAHPGVHGQQPSSEEGGTPPIGPSGVLPQSQRFGPGITTRDVAAFKAAGATSGKAAEIARARRGLRRMGLTPEPTSQRIASMRRSGELPSAKPQPTTFQFIPSPSHTRAEPNGPATGDEAWGGHGNDIVVGRVRQVAGGHMVVDAEDGNRYMVDWRNGGKVRVVNKGMGTFKPRQLGGLTLLPSSEPVQGQLRVGTPPQPQQRTSWRVDSFSPKGPADAKPGDAVIGPGGTKGVVVGTAMGRIAVDGEDGFRHFIDPQGHEQNATPGEMVGVAMPWVDPTDRAAVAALKAGPEPGPLKWMAFEPGGAHNGKPLAQAKVGDAMVGPGGTQAIVAVKMGGLIGADGADRKRHIIKVSDGSVVQSIPGQPGVAPWWPLPDVPFVDPYDDRAVAKLRKQAHGPTAPGVEVAPGVKQYILPGMEHIGGPGGFGSDSPAAQHLQQIVASGDLDQADFHQNTNQGIQGDVSIVTLPDGSKIVHKVQYSETRNDAEELSSYVSNVVGAGAPAIIRDPNSTDTLIEDFVPGQMAEYAEDEYEMYGTDKGYAIGLLDFLISNSDRHDENWMVNEDDEPVPIDMGYAQFDGEDYGSEFTSENDIGSPDNPVTNQYWDQLHEGLASLKPEFERLGRLTWYDNMMSQLALLNQTEAAKFGMRPGYFAPQEFASLAGQVLELTGLHGHHIPGTPYVYRHGWKEIRGEAPPLPSYMQGQVVTDSKREHSLPDGSYTAEREAFHRRMIEGMLAGHHGVHDPVATFLGGGPAAGKSSIEKTTGSPGVMIAPDDIMKQIPEYRQMLADGDPMASNYNHREATDIADQLQDTAISRWISFTLDGTGDRDYQTMADRVKAVHAEGYQAVARYITLPTDEAVKRAKKRAEKTGRMVPEPAIRAIHQKVSSIFTDLAENGVFDHAELWDNNVPRGASPRLIGSGSGAGWHVWDQGGWQQFVSKRTGQ